MNGKMYSDITGGTYTPAEFKKMIEKRIRKRLRQQRLIQENTLYVIQRGLSGHQQLLKRLLAELYGDRITIVEPDDPRAETASPLQAKPLEECAGEGLDYFLECKSVDTFCEDVPNPLKYCSNKECKQLAIIYG
ncbi:MAG: hypothetical protein ACOCU6_01335, partial [Nanoarchaeota archaeon]